MHDADADLVPPPREKGARPTEAECQQTIVDTAHLFGYRVLAIRPMADSRKRWKSPIQGDPGWFDLVLVHPAVGVIFAELKRWPNKVEPAQLDWRAAFLAAGLEARIVWVPEQLADFLRELAQRRRGNR